MDEKAGGQVISPETENESDEYAHRHRGDAFELVSDDGSERLSKNGTRRKPRLDDPRRANQLDGKAWTRYSISIWSDIRKTSEEIRLGHPAMFPAALVERLISIFTNGSQRIVLDPFAGTGTVPLVAKRLGKLGVGVELSSEYVRLAQERIGGSTLFEEPHGRAVVHRANAFDLMEYVGPGTVDLVVTSPPYWNILEERRTADYKEIRNYGDDTDDMGKISEYPEFLDSLQRLFKLVYGALRPGAYCCIVVMDIRKKSRFYPFHSDLASRLEQVGFTYDDVIIWDRRHEYNNMRPLGYPYVFRVNKAHEFILILQRPTDS